ncbi:MAG: ROK family protein [Anaerolineaceae bacterium]
MLRSEKTAQTQSTNNILGMNIDGERILLIYASPTGLVHECLVVPTPNRESFEAILELITVQADKLLNLTKAQHLPVPDRLSVAISGNYDNDTGILGSAQDFPNWKTVPLRSQLALRFNLPVFIEQKANAGALAEYYFGSAQNIRNLVFVSMSPSLRAGILTDGKLYRNPGGTSGQVGNFPLVLDDPTSFGKPVFLDKYVSSHGLLELAKVRHPGHWEQNFDLMQIIQDAHSGDPFAREIFQEAGEWLGGGLACLTTLLRPERIIVGYPGCLIDEYFLAPARAALAQIANLDESQLPKLLPSQLCSRLPELEALAPVVHAARNHL